MQTLRPTHLWCLVYPPEGMQMGMSMQDNIIVPGHMQQEQFGGDGFPGNQAAMMGMAGCR